MTQFPVMPDTVKQDIEAVKNLPKLDINSSYIESKPEPEQKPVPQSLEELEAEDWGGMDSLTSDLANYINLQLTPKKEMTVKEAGERARKVYDISVREELPMSFVDKNLEFYDQGAYQKKVEDWKEVISNMPDAALSAQFAFVQQGNLFGLTSYMSRKGWLFTEESRGDTSAYFDALEQFHAEMARPEINFMGNTVKLPHPAYIAGGIGKTAAEFAMLPGAEKAATWLGGIAKGAAKFGAQTALQAPTMQEQAMPNDVFIKQRALQSLKSAVTGAGVGLAGNFIKNPLYRIPVVTGGFMSLTALEGGTPEQILETGIQILGFELLGLAQSAAMGKVKMKDVVEKAKKVVPELKKASDTEIETILKEFAGTPTMPVEATKQGMGANVPPAPKQEGGTVRTDLEPSRLAERTEEMAIEAELVKQGEFGTLVGYEKEEGFLKEQARLSRIEMDMDWKSAIEMAMGNKPTSDPKLKPASIYGAVKLRARDLGDIETLRRLGTESTIPTLISEYGKQVKAADVRDDSDDVEIIKDVKKQKEKNVDAKLKKQGTDLKTEQAKMAGEMKTEIKKKSLDMDRFVKAIESIRCK